MWWSLCENIKQIYFLKYLYQQNIKKKGNKKDAPEKVKLFDKKKIEWKLYDMSVKQINK